MTQIVWWIVSKHKEAKQLVEFIIEAKQICGTTSSLQLDFARLGHLCYIYDKLKRVRHILCFEKTIKVGWY
jgi:hypothetical protein